MKLAPLYQDGKITIHRIKCGPYDNNAYLLVCPRTNESVVIDTPPDPIQLIEAASATKVKSILITHNHSDHIQGFSQVISAIHAPVGIGEPDAYALPRAPDFVLQDTTKIIAGTIALEAISTPGHTPGSTCFVANKHLFTGDTLFPGGPGKTGTPENLNKIIASIINKLFILNDDVEFYPGHGEGGYLKSEKGKYAVFKSNEHPTDLCGDVLWLKS